MQTNSNREREKMDQMGPNGVEVAKEVNILMAKEEPKWNWISKYA